MGRLANGMKRVAAVAVIAVLPAALGCGAFFQCEGKTSCGTSGSTTDTGDVVFASNSGSTNLYAYYIASDGTLNAVSGSPTALSQAPLAMVVTPDNSLLYVSTLGGIFKYPVSSTGVLSAGIGAGTGTTPSEASMVVSANSKWLLALDEPTVGNSATTIEVYTIGTGGVLAGANSVIIPQGTLTQTPYQIALSSDNKYVAVALGAAGYAVYSFDTSAGTLGSLLKSNSANMAAIGDRSVAFDSNDNVYIAQGGSTGNGLVVYSPTAGMEIYTSGTPSATTGTNPFSLLFAGGTAYLYSANLSDSTISSMTVSSTTTTSTVTANGSATSGPAGVQQLALDSSGKYVLGAGSTASVGLQIFTIATSGTLTAGKTATLGTTSNVAPVLAVTH